MKEEISFTQVPFDYPLCLNEQCPKAATCLRQLAMQSMPTEKDYWKIISLLLMKLCLTNWPIYWFIANLVAFLRMVKSGVG